MAHIDPNASALISEYIESMPPFGKEICTLLRTIILASSDQLVEDWKWGPNYNAQGMVCGYGTFQKHVKVTFFRGAELKDKYGLFNHCVDNISSRSIKYTSVAEVDEKKLAAYVKEAVKLNLHSPTQKRATQQTVIPDALQTILDKNPLAQQHFAAMPAYKQKEFIEQVETAKRPATLTARLEKIVTLLEANVGWNDKYRDMQKAK